MKKTFSFIIMIVIIQLTGCASSYNRYHRPEGGNENFAVTLEERIHATPMGAVLRQNQNITSSIYAHNKQYLIKQYQDEYDLIMRRRGHAPVQDEVPSQLRALCLSGGGIRSATYNLGVLKAFNELKLLDKIDYLSSVSGGGYIAGWYMTHSDDERLWENESPQIRHILSNANYLTTRHASRGPMELTSTAIQHFSQVPLYWIFNGVIFDFDWNIRIWNNFRDVYRERLAYTFLNPAVRLYQTPDEYNKFVARQIRTARGQYRQSAFLNSENAKANPLFVSDLVQPPPAKSRKQVQATEIRYNRPFWIINAGLSLINDSHFFRNQFGDNFEITPLHCGSDATGYVNTDASHDWMRIDYAIATSGAAISRNDIRNPWYKRAVIDLFNLDLGRWIDGWTPAWNEKDPAYQDTINKQRRLLWDIGVFAPFNWLVQLSPESDIGHDRTTESKHHFLSDGGHFENLAAMAPIRRGCRTLIISDCSHDANLLRWNEQAKTTDSFNKIRALAFSDLRRLDMRLMNEYGARLEMNLNDFKTSMPIVIGIIKNLPVQCPNPNLFEKIAKFNIRELTWSPQKLSALREKIREFGDHVVWVIYIKPIYMYDLTYLPISTAYYKAISKDNTFPQESTSDQLYSEDQFTAYRELGYSTIMQYSKVLESFFQL